MIVMQYKIKFNNDFDMNTIKKRVAENGFKTDNFQDLLFKLYLIKDYNHNNTIIKEYSPLYIWKNNLGMNKFIFDGFYDNILKSFGWQKINIYIPYSIDIKEDFHNSKYILEIENEIAENQIMENLNFSIDINNLGRFITYNPDKWIYKEYYLLDILPDEYINSKNIYNILWISK